MAKLSKCAAWTLCVLSVASTLTTAQCASQAFTASKLESALALFKFKQTGSFGSMEKTFQGCEVWKAVPDVQSDKVKPMCEWLHKKGLQPANVSTAYHALSAFVARNCDDDPELAQTVEDMLLAGGSAADLIPLHHSALGLLILKEKGWAKENVASGSALEKAWATIKALSTLDGKFRFSSEGEDEGSYLAAGLAVETGAALLQLGLKPPGDEVALLKKAVSKMWAASVTTEEGVLVPSPLGESGGAVASTSAAVKGTIALHTATKETLKVAAKLQGAAEYLLSIGSPSTTSEAYHQISALSILNNNKVLVPLVVRLPTLIYTWAALDLPVFVSGVLGSVPPVDGAKVVSLTAAGGKAMAAHKEMTAKGSQEGAKFVLDLGAQGVKEVGEYTAKFEVSVAPLYSVSARLVTTFVLAEAVSVTGVVLSVVDGDGTVDQSAASGEQEGQVVSVEEEGKKPKLSATHLQTLKVVGKVVGRDANPFVPQQVILKLVHKSGREFIFVTKPVDGIYTFRLPFLKMMDQLFYASGVYTIKLIVGDTRMDSAFTWFLGQVDLDLPSAPETAPNPPLLKSLTAKFGPASEISHIFRQPEKRPTSLVSYAFSVLSLLPLVGFLAGLGFLGINFDAFPTSGVPLVSAAAFHGGIALILLLYFQFWLNMNLFFTLKTLVVIGLATIVPGHLILAYLANSSNKLKTS